MELSVLLWILGGVFICIGFGVTAWVKIIQNQNSHSEHALVRHNGLETRVVKIETILTMFGKRAATILHSPHTPELDTLLEIYVDRHYELSHAQWKRLKELCEEVIKEPHIKGDKVVFASFLSALADHKLELPEKL